jgi:hypothetical protein
MDYMCMPHFRRSGALFLRWQSLNLSCPGQVMNAGNGSTPKHRCKTYFSQLNLNMSRVHALVYVQSWKYTVATQNAKLGGTPMQDSDSGRLKRSRKRTFFFLASGMLPPPFAETVLLGVSSLTAPILPLSIAMYKTT